MVIQLPSLRHGQWNDGSGVVAVVVVAVGVTEAVNSLLGTSPKAESVETVGMDKTDEVGIGFTGTGRSHVLALIKDFNSVSLVW